MIFYFSATGNSLWIARQIGGMLSDSFYNLIEAASTNETYTLQKNESIGFVFPVHAWGVPRTVIKCMRNLHFTHKPDYVYFICTCGDDTGKTASVFIRECQHCGWECNAGFSVIMPNTYVCLPGFDTDAPEVEHEKLNQMSGRIKNITTHIHNRICLFDCKEGTIPWIKTYLIQPLFNWFLMSPKWFQSLDTCISCGICEKVCPSKNIYMENGKPKWGKQCTMCLACYHHCPKHAIDYARQTNAKGQSTMHFISKKTHFVTPENENKG